MSHIYATPELTLPSSSAGYASGASSGCDHQPPQVYHLSRAAPAPGTAKKDELKQPIPEIYLTRLISTKGERLERLWFHHYIALVPPQRWAYGTAERYRWSSRGGASYT